MKNRIRAFLLAAMFVVSLLPVMSMADSAVAKIGNTSYDTLQGALTAAYTQGGEVTVTLLTDVTEQVSIREKNDHKLTLDGAGKKLTGQIDIVGNSEYETNNATVIKNLTIDVSGATESGIYVPEHAWDTNRGRYTQNVTIDNCKFTNSNSGRGIEAISQGTGGCKDWKIIGCNVDSTMHSMLQANNFMSIEIVDCKVNSKNGINLVNSERVVVSNCEVSVDGYGLRSGASSGDTVVADITIENCEIETSGLEGDPAVVTRATTTGTITLEETTVVAGNNQPAINITGSASSAVTITMVNCDGTADQDNDGIWESVTYTPPVYGGPVMNWIKVNAAENGVVKSGPLAASEGATITLYPKASAGYVLDTVEVLDAQGNAVQLDGLKFQVPLGGVTVNAAFKPAE